MPCEVDMAVGDSFKSGPQVLPLGGQTSQASTGQKAEVIVASTRADYYDLNYNGRIFHGATAVGGHANNQATTLGTTSAIVISNPANSGVNAVILKAYWQLVSATAVGICGLQWAYCLAASTGGTAGTVAGGKLAGGNKCTVYSGATSFSSTAILLRPSGMSFSAYAGGVVNPQPPIEEIVGGDIIAPPNSTVGLVAIGAAGTAELVIMGLSWAEEPI